MSLLIATGLVALLAAWLLSEPWRTARARRAVGGRPFPTAWRRILRRRVPLIARMPADLQLQLKKLVQVFLAEKPFIGCNGLAVTEEMRVTIAAQACLLILNRATGIYPGLRQVLVYPGPFVVDRVRGGAAGEVHEQRQVLSGESWTQGQVILSWPDVLDGAAVPNDGRNVVIHEFAHQLDQEGGHANGAPALPSGKRYASWSAVLGEEYARLRERNLHAPHAAPADGGLIDGYGASDPAEFFAVVSEAFFEQPGRLADEHAALYAELARYYRIDPAHW